MNFKELKNKIIGNLVFVLISSTIYSLSYFVVYHFPLLPWGSIFDGGRANLFYFIFYGIMPAYIMLSFVKWSLKNRKSPHYSLIIINFFIGFITVTILESILNPNSGYSEFALFNVLPSLLFYFAISIYIVKKERKKIV